MVYQKVVSSPPKRDKFEYSQGFVGSPRRDEFEYNYDEPAQSSGYTPNPATPGYHADTPSPIQPYTPQTPGSAYSPYAAHPSPSPSSYQGQLECPCGIYWSHLTS